MRRAAVLALSAIAVGGCGGRLWAALPPQFEAWGSAGPDLPAVPDGWTEAPVEPEGLPPLTPTAEETGRGFVVFARDPLAAIPATCIPAPSERATELYAFCALGEYEPLSFAIRALHDLPEVRIGVTELRTAGGQSIPLDHVDVRVVRAIRVPAGARAYRMEPFLLEKCETLAIAAGTTAQVWLTVKVPEDAQPGPYAGTVSVKPAGGETLDLPVRMDILPFALPPAPVEMGMFVPRPPGDDGLLRRQLIDMREHGMTAVQPTPDAEVVSRDQQLGDDDVAAIRAECVRRMRLYREVYGAPRFPVTIEIGHQIAYYWDPATNWFAFWPHGAAIEADLLKALDTILEVARDEGWPPVRVYALDEAGAHNLLDEAVYYYRFLKEQRPELTTWTTIGGGIAMGHDEIGQLSGVVDRLSTNRFSPEIAKALVDRDQPYGIYNGAGRTPASARFFFGFHGWKTGADEIMQWTYSFGDNVFAGSGIRADDEGYVYSAGDGPLPSIMWEAAREGVDDYRYLYTLWQAAHSEGISHEAAGRARSVLNEVMRQIPWTFQAVRGSDRTPPPHPSTLRKWRRQVANAIVDLLDNGATPSPAGDVPRPSPFDWEWQAPEPVTIVYGDELLPPSDFEAGLAPWRVEAWEGTGSGELSAGDGRGGSQCVRVDVPTEATNKAVTVLVWPTWGGGGLDLRLEGDHTYEFSAWVKLEGRGTLPELRISLPAGAERLVATGQNDPDENGWQRVWRRVELAFPAQPTYIAAWVQGPGTAWVDDLSLREAVPPPLSMALDQAEYDGLDRLGIATVSISKLASPASLSIVLARVGGERVGVLTTAFRAQTQVAADADSVLSLVAPSDLRSCRAVFDPSSLTPGQYTLAATLLDAEGASMGEAVVPFRRLTD